MVPFGLNSVPLQETETVMLPDLSLPAVDDGNPTGEEEEGEDAGTVEEAIVAHRLASKGLKAGDIEALVMIQRIARRMAPEMRKAFLFAVEKAKKKMSVAEIAAAFETRSLSVVMSKVPIDVFEEAFGEKGEKVLKQTLKLAGDHAAKRFSSMIPHSVCGAYFLVRWLAKVISYLQSDGMLFWTFTGGYGVARFLVEFFREPDPQVGFVLRRFSMGQILSLAMILTAAVFLSRITRDRSD